MKKTREELKSMAVGFLQKVGIYRPFIDQFEKEDKITMFISGIGYTIDEQTEDNLLAVIKKVENNGERLVYAVSKNVIGNDIVYALLLVTQEDSNVDDVGVVCLINGVFIYDVLAYCYNADCDYCSEYGYITVQNRYGGIRRIG